MAFSSVKFAEKLLILKEIGTGVLERVHQVRKNFAGGSSKPNFFTDAAYKKVNEAIVRKFPDFETSVDKTPGYDQFLAKAKQHYEELEAPYYAIIDAYEFKEAALPVLNEVSSGTVDMKLEENPNLTSHFLELFAIYCQVNFLVASIEERKPLLAAFYKLFLHIKCINESGYSKVANYLTNFDVPIKAMQDEFKPISANIGKTLMNLAPIMNRLRLVPQLRKDGVLNLTSKPEDMAKPITDKFRYQIPYSPQIHIWMLYGFLLCPETLSLPGAVDLLLTVLKEGYAIPVYRDLILPIHTEFSDLFKNYKSANKNFNLSKQKKAVSEAAQECGEKGGKSRKVRRVFLRQEMNSLVHIFTDKPCLLAPKLQVALAALSLAKEEVFWFFRHQATQPPKSVAKKFIAEDFQDNRISELIHAIVQLTTLIKNNKKMIQQYYVEYLRGADYSKLSELVNDSFSSSVGAGPGAICRAIVEEIGSASENSSFKVLRLNWFRAESALCSIQSQVPIAKIREAVDRFNLVVSHTRFVDSLDELLDQNASLRGLYYFKGYLASVFDKAVKDGPNQPLHAISFIKVVSDFPNNITTYTAEEKENVGRESVQFAEKLIGEINLRIAALIQEIAKQYLIFDSKLADVNAAYPLLIKKPDFKPPKDFSLPETPGNESEFKRRAEFDRLRLYERNAYQLCSVLQEIETVVVHDHKFTPREYLKEKIVESLRKFLRAGIITEIRDDKHVEKVLTRPSSYERQIYTYLSVLKIVEDFVDLDLIDVVRDVIMTEIWIPAAGKLGSFDWLALPDTDFTYETGNGPKVVGSIVTWYADFIAKKLSLPGVCYSNPRKGFVSRSGLNFRAENYADIEELKALFRLVGPYGVRLLDREVLKFIMSNVTTIKEFAAHNKQALDELAGNYINENQCNESLKKLKDCDTFLNKSIAIGNALYFRDTLHEAARLTIQDKTPFIHDSVKTLFRQYKRNTYLTPDLLPADALAYDVGLDLGTSDQGLKKMLSKTFTTTDAALINALPYLYAASFSSTLWKEAQFRPLIEAHTNNVNALARTINYLIICGKSITSADKNDVEIPMLLKAFVDVSSVILLRMAKNASKPDKHFPVEFPSVVIFIDRFVAESPVVTRDLLEDSMPYALLRNYYKSIFAPRAMKKNQEVAAVDVF